MSSEAQVPSFRQEELPFFLQKLWQMVDDHSTDNMVKWSPAGDSFVVVHQERFAHDLLPRYFKHRNFTSFVRQLNMYGFRKIVPTDSGLVQEREQVEFLNPFFRRGQRESLDKIKRKSTSTKHALVSTSHVSSEDISQVVSTLRELKSRQDQVAMSLKTLADDNKGLWSEVVSLRQQVQRQDVIIKKLFAFITQFVSPVKRNRLAIMPGEDILEPPAKAADIQYVSDDTAVIEHFSPDDSGAVAIPSFLLQQRLAESDAGVSGAVSLSEPTSVATVGEVYDIDSTIDSTSRNDVAVAPNTSAYQPVVAEPETDNRSSLAVSSQSPSTTAVSSTETVVTPASVARAESPRLFVDSTASGKAVGRAPLLPPQPDCKPECPDTCGQHLESVQKGLNHVQQYLSENVLSSDGPLDDLFDYSIDPSNQMFTFSDNLDSENFFVDPTSSQGPAGVPL